HELAVALGLALPGAPQHGEKLADGLARHDGLEEYHRLGHALQIDVEIGAREAEHDAHVGFREHDGIHQHAAVGVLERDHERRQEFAPDQAAHHVGAPDLVEHRPDDLDPIDAAPFAA